MYFIRYGMGVSSQDGASLSATTQNTFKVLTLSLAKGHPDVVVYNIWVAVVTNSQEQGNAKELTIQYSSELKLVIIQALQCVSFLLTHTVNPNGSIRLSCSMLDLMHHTVNVHNVTVSASF